MKVYVFDLDDTLYDEITFVRSGFRAVANYLSEFGIPAEDAYQRMCSILEKQGRGQVFNDMLLHYGLGGQRHIRKCLSIYRLHNPKISLRADAEEVLNELKELPIYIVTDGNKVVQHNKLLALGLYARVKKCFITYRHGRIHSKPSPYCFHKISLLEKVDPSDIVYIGDNPNKDFVGIKPLGFRTIRIRNGAFKDLSMPESYNADAEIESLSELFKVIKQWGE